MLARHHAHKERRRFFFIALCVLFLTLYLLLRQFPWAVAGVVREEDTGADTVEADGADMIELRLLQQGSGESSTIAIKLLPKLSGPSSVAYIHNLVGKCSSEGRPYQRCRFYRAEPDFLLQGSKATPFGAQT